MNTGTRPQTTAAAVTAVNGCAPTWGKWMCRFLEAGRGEFASQVVKKDQISSCQDIEAKSLSMDAKIMTAGDMGAYIQGICSISFWTVRSVGSRIRFCLCPTAAAAASGIHLCRGISGRHPLSWAQGRTEHEESTIHCHWH